IRIQADLLAGRESFAPVRLPRIASDCNRSFSQRDAHALAFALYLKMRAERRRVRGARRNDERPRRVVRDCEQCAPAYERDVAMAVGEAHSDFAIHVEMYERTVCERDVTPAFICR